MKINKHIKEEEFKPYEIIITIDSRREQHDLYHALGRANWILNTKVKQRLHATPIDIVLADFIERMRSLT